MKNEPDIMKNREPALLGKPPPPTIAESSYMVSSGIRIKSSSTWEQKSGTHTGQVGSPWAALLHKHP